ncbi:MAG: hypothetical protein PHS47_00980 [Methanocellales archaeon]|nr:hypothetical protein [Methanocellales archaeon]
MAEKEIPFWKKLFENLIIRVITYILVPSALIYFLRDRILNLHKLIMTTKVNPYFIIIAIFVTFVIMILFDYLRRKKRKSSGFFGAVRLRRGDEQEIPFRMGGLKWIAYTPKQRFSLIDERDEYVWLTGPFCPECNLTLQWKKNIIKSKWYCESCNKNFYPFKRTAKECRDYVEEICYVKFFREGKFTQNN